MTNLLLYYEKSQLCALAKIPILQQSELFISILLKLAKPIIFPLFSRDIIVICIRLCLRQNLKLQTRKKFVLKFSAL